jgi:hypothetical protein
LGNGAFQPANATDEGATRRRVRQQIIEGPHTWKVRPLAEFFYECEFGQAQTASALVGLIWQVQGKLALDLAVREAVTNGQPVNEIRAGLTYSLDLGRRRETGK